MSRFMGVTIEGIWIGYLIYRRNSELQLITASSLICTLYSSLLKKTLTLLQTAVSSTAVFLVTNVNSADFSASRAQVLPIRRIASN
jgi:hypothetical protein